MRAIVLGDLRTVVMFKLMGFEGEQVEDRDALLRRLGELVEDRTVSAIFITTAVSRLAKREIASLRGKLRRPLIVELPSIEDGQVEEVDYLQLVRQAIGG